MHDKTNFKDDKGSYDFIVGYSIKSFSNKRAVNQSRYFPSQIDIIS